MTIKTSDLTGYALNYAVILAKYPKAFENKPSIKDIVKSYPYSTDWVLAGPIIDREKIELKYLGYDNPPYWGALKFSPSKYERKAAIGPSPLIAAMRCYVASRLGDEVEVPHELT